VWYGVVRIIIHFYIIKSHAIFTSGWALKENEKIYQRDQTKRMSACIKTLLEHIFHTGTANSQQKMNAQQMQEELLQRVEQGELELGDVPKTTTIQSWISRFSRHWKKAIALCSLDEAKGSNTFG